MKHFRKATAIMLSVILILSLSVTSLASVGVETNTDQYTVAPKAERIFFDVITSAVNAAVKGLAGLFPTPASWEETEEVPGFMAGTETFLTTAPKNAKWSLGYDARSILPEDKDDVIGKLYVGGSIGVTRKVASDIHDDLKVRTVALNDGTGRGTALLLAVDSYGLALSDVRTIRMRLAELTETMNINSITVCVLHQHSAVDTFGMNGNIWEMALINPFRTAAGVRTVNGKNKVYMENLFNQCVQSAQAAVGAMKKGELYMGQADASQYTVDKRQPYVMDPNFTRLRFVPDDGSRETWLVSSPIHCVGNGAAGTVITGDYPYYAEQEVNAAGANLMFVLGAEQSTSQNRNENTVVDYHEDSSRLETTEGFGKAIGRELIGIKNDKRVEPLLNIRYQEISLKIDNAILLLAGKASMFQNIVRKIDGAYQVVTEIGYMEIGSDMAFAVIPGELAPEIAFGGCLDEKYAWSGENWNYPSLQEEVTAAGRNRDLYVLGLANDQIGYIVPDNNYISMLHEDSDSIEFVSLGKNTASEIVKSFDSLLKDLGEKKS